MCLLYKTDSLSLSGSLTYFLDHCAFEHKNNEVEALVKETCTLTSLISIFYGSLLPLFSPFSINLYIFNNSCSMVRTVKYILI